MIKNWFAKPITEESVTSNEKLQISPEIILEPEVTKSLFDQSFEKTLKNELRNKIHHSILQYTLGDEDYQMLTELIPAEYGGRLIDIKLELEDLKGRWPGVSKYLTYHDLEKVRLVMPPANILDFIDVLTEQSFKEIMDARS